MWTREELKSRAKQAISLSYWKAVLVGIILSITGNGVSVRINNINNSNSEEVRFLRGLLHGNYYISEREKVLLIVAAIIVLIVVAAAICFNVFLSNPLLVGGKKFFNSSLDSEAKSLSDVGIAFKSNYGNIVKVMFLMDLYVFLWSLLFIIPGIIKSYEYLMVPYILGENPDISAAEAFTRSKEMMDGQKMNAFVLQLSFLGWIILSAFTAGILNIFYLNPYIEYTRAALYRELSGQNIPVVD